jgi:hypothetical protein
LTVAVRESAVGADKKTLLLGIIDKSGVSAALQERLHNISSTSILHPLRNVYLFAVNA